MAISTYKTELHNGATSSGDFTKFCDIKNYPDLFGEPNEIETTTLSDDQQTFIPGIKTSQKLPFTINWEKEIAKKIKEMEGKESFWKVKFQDGTEFAFGGYPSLGVPGGEVDGVVEATLTITPSTTIEMDTEPGA